MDNRNPTDNTPTSNRLSKDDITEKFRQTAFVPLDATKEQLKRLKQSFKKRLEEDKIGPKTTQYFQEDLLPSLSLELAAHQKIQIEEEWKKLIDSKFGFGCSPVEKILIDDYKNLLDQLNKAYGFVLQYNGQVQSVINQFHTAYDQLSSESQFSGMKESKDAFELQLNQYNTNHPSISTAIKQDCDAQCLIYQQRLDEKYEHWMNGFASSHGMKDGIAYLMDKEKALTKILTDYQTLINAIHDDIKNVKKLFQKKRQKLLNECEGNKSQDELQVLQQSLQKYEQSFKNFVHTTDEKIKQLQVSWNNGEGKLTEILDHIKKEKERLINNVNAFDFIELQGKTVISSLQSVKQERKKLKQSLTQCLEDLKNKTDDSGNKRKNIEQIILQCGKATESFTGYFDDLESKLNNTTEQYFIYILSLVLDKKRDIYYSLKNTKNLLFNHTLNEPVSDFLTHLDQSITEAKAFYISNTDLNEIIKKPDSDIVEAFDQKLEIQMNEITKNYNNDLNETKKNLIKGIKNIPVPKFPNFSSLHQHLNKFRDKYEKVEREKTGKIEPLKDILQKKLDMKEKEKAEQKRKEHHENMKKIWAEHMEKMTEEIQKKKEDEIQKENREREEKSLKERFGMKTHKPTDDGFYRAVEVPYRYFMDNYSIFYSSEENKKITDIYNQFKKTRTTDRNFLDDLENKLVSANLNHPIQEVVKRKLDRLLTESRLKIDLQLRDLTQSEQFKFFSIYLPEFMGKKYSQFCNVDAILGSFLDDKMMSNGPYKINNELTRFNTEISSFNEQLELAYENYNEIKSILDALNNINDQLNNFKIHRFEKYFQLSSWYAGLQCELGEMIFSKNGINNDEKIFAKEMIEQFNKELLKVNESDTYRSTQLLMSSYYDYNDKLISELDRLNNSESGVNLTVLGGETKQVLIQQLQVLNNLRKYLLSSQLSIDEKQKNIAELVNVNKEAFKQTSDGRNFIKNVEESMQQAFNAGINQSSLKLEM